MIDEEDEGVSLGEIFHTIWKRKILLGIITVVTTVILVLLVAFIYNPSKKVYESRFELNFAGSDSNTYPTGRTFNYKNIVSKEKIQKVIDSDKKYSFLDAEKIIENNNITISRENNDNDNAYVITIKGLRKGNTNLYRSFVSDLVNLTYAEIENDINKINYVNELDIYNTYKTYDQSLVFLQNQFEGLNEKYNALLSEYKDSYVVNGRNLKSYVTEIDAYFSTSNFSSLLSIANKNNYVFNIDEYNKYVESESISLEKTYFENKSRINNLKDTYDELSKNGNYGESLKSIGDLIAELVDENSIIENKLKDMGYYLNGNEFIINNSNVSPTVNQEFNMNVQKSYNKLHDFYQVYEDNVKEIYHNKTNLSFEKNSIIEENGTISLAIVVVGGIVIGLILGGVIILIIEHNKPSNNEEKEDVKA